MGRKTWGWDLMSKQGENPSNPTVLGRARNRYRNLDRWAQLATIIGLPVAVVGTLASVAALGLSSNPKPSPSPSLVITSVAPVSQTSSAAPTASQSGIPSQDLGSWGGFVNQNNGLTERFVMNLSQGSPGGQVGTFSNQTLNCQGTILLNGITTVTLSGAAVPAADLNLQTTQDPNGACTQSVEAYVASADGRTLVMEVVTAGTAQGGLQNPLAVGDLSH
jgi:hypothetical protein